jgi:dolichol-phosphate mannosyltransferase
MYERVPTTVASLSLIVPTYNEKENLAPFVEGVFAALEGQPFELLIVDDGSPDGTGELADRLAKERPNMRVLHRAGKQGRGTAFAEGLKATDGEWVAIMDADMQHPPPVLATLWAKAREGADLVIASRYVEGGGAEGRTRARGGVSKGALWLSHFFVPQTRHVMDTQSGFFLFRRKGIEGATLSVKGFTVLVEVLARGTFDRVVEVPYTFGVRAGGDSKLGMGEIVGYSRQLLRLSDYRALKFVAVGASGVIVNNGLLLLLVSSAGLPPQAASLGAIEGSILTNFLLNNLWTFKHRKGEPFHVKLAKYHASVALGAAINFVAFTLLHASGVALVPANTVGIGLGFLFNYLLSEKFVWKIP